MVRLLVVPRARLVQQIRRCDSPKIIEPRTSEALRRRFLIERDGRTDDGGSSDITHIRDGAETTEQTSLLRRNDRVRSE